MSAGDKFYTKVLKSVQMPDGSYEEKLIDEASDGDENGIRGERSYRCVLCGLAFKESKVRLFRERPYGIPCGCYKDIESILRSEHRDRRKTLRREDHGRY